MLEVISRHEKERFNLNQFGGSLGGPIKKDKTFFFIDYQGTRRRLGRTLSAKYRRKRCGMGISRVGLVHSSIPTAQRTPRSHPFQCDGEEPDPRRPLTEHSRRNPCNKIPSSLIDPIAQQMIDLYPLPNTLSRSLFGNFVNAPVRTLDENSFDVRVDHNFSSSDSVFRAVQLRSSDRIYPRWLTRVCGSKCIWKHPEHRKPWPQCIAFGDTYLLVEQHQPDQRRVQPNLQLHPVVWSGTCKSEELGIPGANLGRDQLRTHLDQVGGGWWSLEIAAFHPSRVGPTSSTSLIRST